MGRFRYFLSLIFCLLLLGCSSLRLSNGFAELESRFGGRLGVSALNTATGERINYRADERFPMCSTFKAILVAAVLHRAGTSDVFLKKKLPITRKTVADAGYSPITTKRAGDGMSIGELCAATLQYSDNAAANLLMKELGGPGAVTEFARLLGDETFRLDRWEPELNSARPADPRDTTTPGAMVETLHTLLVSNSLAPAQNERFQTWLKGNTTGNKRLRAGVPRDWLVGDKTGSGSYGTTADIGIVYPPADSPWLLAVYFTQPEKDAALQEAVIAAATRLIMPE